MDLDARKSELQAELDKLNKMDSVIDKMIKTASDGGFTHLTKEQLAGLLMGEKPKKAVSPARKAKVNYIDDHGVEWSRPSRKDSWTKKQREQFAQRAKDRYGE